MLKMPLTSYGGFLLVNNDSSIHLIKPEDDEYDISFNEIHIPFDIRISSTRRLIASVRLNVSLKLYYMKLCIFNLHSSNV